MLTDLITYGFCIALAIGAVFAWANAETKYRRQRNKIFELSALLKSAQRDLRELQNRSGVSDSSSKKYHDALIKIGAVLGASGEQTDTTNKIYGLLNSALPEAVMMAKRPKSGSANKRSKEETEEFFHAMKEKMGSGSSR